jgi:DNA-binding transcriptional LysR family regulator
MSAIDGLDLNLLPVLTHLLETGSATETARRLGRTQSAISHSLGLLRRHLGDPLFVRVGNRFEPTPRARALGAGLTSAFSTLAQTLAPEAFEPRTLERTFRVLLSDYLQTIVLPGLLGRLREEAPLVRLDVHFRSDAMVANLVDVAAGRLELTIGPVADAPAGVVRQALFSDVNVCALRKRHPALRKWSVRSFAALHHVQVSARGWGEDFVDQALARHGLRRQVVLRLPQCASAPALLARSDAVAVVPGRLAATWRHELAIVDAPVALPDFTMAQYFPETQRKDAAHGWLRRAIAEQVQGPRSPMRAAR